MASYLPISRETELFLLSSVCIASDAGSLSIVVGLGYVLFAMIVGKNILSFGLFWLFPGVLCLSYVWTGLINRFFLRPAQKKEGMSETMQTFPIPNRLRSDFPIIGPSWFCERINAILGELATKAPKRYREAIEYLPKAEYYPELWKLNPGAAARSDGLFLLAQGYDYAVCRDIFLHEVGHNVKGLQGDDWSEEAADSYVVTVTRELETYEKGQKDMNQLQLEAVTAYFEDAGLDAWGNPKWRCLETGHCMQGSFLWLYRELGSDCLGGLSVLGFPRSEEIGISYNSGFVVLQVFDGGVLAFDSDHVLGLRPGSPVCFLVSLSSPILQELGNVLNLQAFSLPDVEVQNGAALNGKKKQRGRPRTN